jgi:hypothetical protein
MCACARVRQLTLSPQTWSSLEFGTESGVGAQRWKLLHYYARRFYRPQLISADHLRATGDIRVVVNNDWVRWAVRARLDAMQYARAAHRWRRATARGRWRL